MEVKIMTEKMRNRKFLTLFAFAMFVLYNSCGGAPLNPYAPTYVGQIFYLCCNMYAPSPAFHDANYQYPGKFIPLGTQVRIENLTDTAVVFTNLQSGLRYTWMKRYARVPIVSLLQVWFVKEDPKQIVDTFEPNIRSAVYAGKVFQGMTKAQVIRALGFPPQHKTPDTSMDIWTYWSGVKPYTIRFQNGIAVEITTPQIGMQKIR